jgi:TonB family protein
MGLPLKDPPDAVIIDKEDAPPGAEVETGPKMTVGDRLAAARKARGLSYQDVFNGTKIKIANLAAIETGDRASLPATPFTVGFIKAYAQFLGLSPEECATAYRAEQNLASEAAAPSPVPPSAEFQAAGDAAPKLAPSIEAPAPAYPRNARAIGPENYVSYFGIGATVLCALWIGGSMIAPKGEAPKPEARIEQAAPAAGPATTPTALETAASPTTIDLAPPPVDAAPAAGNVASLSTAPTADPPQSPEASADEPQAAAEPPSTPEQKKPRDVEVDVAKVEALKSALGGAAPSDSEEPAPVVETPAPQRKPSVAEAAPAAGEVKTPTTDGPPSDAFLAAPEASPPTAAAPPAAPPAAAAPAAAAPQQTAPSGVVEAKLMRKASPTYPKRCTSRAQTVETVRVGFSISAEGRPVGVYVIESSNECFNSAAVDAAYDMRYSPRTENGAKVVQSGKDVTLRFQQE